MQMIKKNTNSFGCDRAVLMVKFFIELKRKKFELRVIEKNFVKIKLCLNK